MYNKIFKFIFITLFLFQSNNNLFSSTIDTLKPVNSIIIEENTKEIITGIKKASVSPNGKYLGIVNQTGFFIALYNIDNGKLLKSFWSSDTLSDYFINKSKLFKSDYERKYRIIDRKTSEGLKFDKSLILNDFNNIRFLDENNIIVGGTFRSHSIDTTSLNIKGKKINDCILNAAGYYRFNINLNILNASIFETTSYEFPLSCTLYPYSDSTYIETVQNFLNLNNDSLSQFYKDTLTAFSLFDSEGNHIKLICNLPNDYMNPNLKYGIFELKALICKVKDKFLWTTSQDYKIRGLFDTTSFELKGFDSTNYLTWIEMKNIPKEEQKNYLMGIKSVTLYLSIENIDSWKDSLIAIYLRQRKDYVQFYDLNGNLKKHYVLNIPEKQELDYLVFDSKRNRILVITKDDENYHLLTYKVE